MKIIKLVLMPVCLVLVLAACNLPEARQVQATPTIDSQALVGTIAAMTLQAMTTSTFTPSPTEKPTITPTATQTLTITPTYSVPSLLFNGNTNCRQGPGEDYEVITVLRNGQQVEAVGRSGQTNYWLVKRPDNAETCWASADFAQVSGSLHLLPTVVAPPTSTPKPPTGPTWASWNYTCEFAGGGSNLNMRLAWSDRNNNETGYIVYRDGQVIANLGPNTTSYTDVILVTAGQTVSYKVEVITPGGKVSTSTVSAACQ